MKVPPTCVWTSEFDFYKKDNIKYAERLKKNGRLLDLSNMPGMTHGYQLSHFNSDENKWFWEEEKMAFDAWVRN